MSAKREIDEIVEDEIREAILAGVTPGALEYAYMHKSVRELKVASRVKFTHILQLRKRWGIGEPDEAM
jgi:hypothetical protein